MPANLSPEFLAAEENFKKAATSADKLRALEAMLRTIPKHKGTEKMQADIKRRISRLRKESAKKKSAAIQRPHWYVEREGAGQVVLCGPPNSGKSQLLANLTNVEPEVANYPFTTRTSLPGMMPALDIQIQLVDMPPLAANLVEPWQLAMIQQTDIALVVFNVTDPELLEQTEFILEQLTSRQIQFQSDDRPRVIVLGNKIDLPQGQGNFAAWEELYRERFRPQAFCALAESRLNNLRSQLFDTLGIVRVYTKAPSKKPEKNPTPYVLRKGCTVLDAAASIHKDLVSGFKFARIWGKTKFDGQMVEREYQLEDGDLIEIHT